jgi:hypothetical protein
MIKTHDWSKVAVVLNAEHTSQTLLYMYNTDLMTSNAVSARRWFASGSPEFQQLVKKTLQDFNVSVYKVPEARAGGSLGPVSPYAPSFHIIDHVIYHTTLDTPELVPAVGLAWSERAFLKILDETNKQTMAQIRGSIKLPNPIK